MKKFIIKTVVISVVFVIVNLLLFLAIPKDKNEYLCEYNHKIQLLETTCQPRIIFIGGSNVAFDIISRTISDSLHKNVVNFGLQAGIGIRFPLEDCIKYIKEGDIVIMQFEYANFFNGGNGEKETLSAFMIASDWRNLHQLNRKQILNVIKGIPKTGSKNLHRLIGYLMGGYLDSPVSGSVFTYVKSGFNEYGDEVSHLNYAGKRYVSSGKHNDKKIDSSFIEWLSNTISRYEESGAQVIMMPPACVKSFFNDYYNPNIADALIRINKPYIIPPESITYNDSLCFNTGYHLNKDGVEENTDYIIKVLSQYFE